MTKRADYTYERILDIMVCGKISETNRNDAKYSSWLHFDEPGKKYFYSYQFLPDLRQIYAHPPGSFTEKQYLPLSRATTPVPVNREYVVLCVKTDWIYDKQATDQVKICLEWLQKSDGPSKIKINCHGHYDGKIYMGDHPNSKIKNDPNKKNGVPGENIADWLVVNGLRSPQVEDVLIDASHRQEGWSSRSNATQCPSCKMVFIEGQRTIHCRSCGEVVHYNCTKPALIKGSLKTTRLERWFSSTRDSNLVTDQVCKNCSRHGSIIRRPLTGAERDAKEDKYTRGTYNGVINIGMWVCYGGTSLKDNPDINPADDTALEGSIANRLALRLTQRGVTGIEITGRTDVSYQTQVSNPDGSANPYYKLHQRVDPKNPRAGGRIVKKRQFS